MNYSKISLKTSKTLRMNIPILYQHYGTLVKLYIELGYFSDLSINYHFSANIASELTASNYGLVFGWNTFVAVLLQSILTFAVADSHGFNLAIRAQVWKLKLLPNPKC